MATDGELPAVGLVYPVLALNLQPRPLAYAGQDTGDALKPVRRSGRRRGNGMAVGTLVNMQICHHEAVAFVTINDGGYRPDQPRHSAGF